MCSVYPFRPAFGDVRGLASPPYGPPAAQGDVDSRARGNDGPRWDGSVPSELWVWTLAGIIGGEQAVALDLTPDKLEPHG